MGFQGYNWLIFNYIWIIYLSFDLLQIMDFFPASHTGKLYTGNIDIFHSNILSQLAQYGKKERNPESVTSQRK